MTEGICPSGWHIPSDGEFTQLTDFLGGESVAGGKMKDDVLWNGSNSSGFTALPGGLWNICCPSPFYSNIGETGSWWSSSDGNVSSSAWCRRILTAANVYKYSTNKSTGESARCVLNYTDECVFLTETTLRVMIAVELLTVMALPVMAFAELVTTFLV